jgi:hypothetical protein
MLSSKWKATIMVGGKSQYLGYFEGTAAGEMEAALVYDVAARAARRPKSSNFDEPTDGTEPPKKFHARGASQYHGVAWSKQSSKWKATIMVGGKSE